MSVIFNQVPGLYGWVDGWPVKFTNWDRRQPSYNGGCVMVNKRDRWDDTACNKQLHYVCKITSGMGSACCVDDKLFFSL